MKKQFTANGDPARTLELLWGARRAGDPAAEGTEGASAQPAGRRGPKQRRSTDEVVQAAIAIADLEGVDALSMRKVAEALSVSPMSLYTYVPSKAELLDLMFDRVLQEAEDPGPDIVGWRAHMAFMARQRWALSQRHPWLMDLALHRPPLGPNLLRKAETAFRAFQGMGLSSQEMGQCAEALQNYVAGAIQAAREARELERRSGLTDAEWLRTLRPLLDRYMDAQSATALEHLSDAHRVLFGDVMEPIARFEFGLELMLDGLEAFIDRRSTRADPRD